MDERQGSGRGGRGWQGVGGGGGEGGEDGDAGAVRAWLVLQRRGALAPAFLEDGYDTLDAVAGMTWDGDLSAIAGMKRGFRGPLERAIAALKEETGDAAGTCGVCGCLWGWRCCVQWGVIAGTVPPVPALYICVHGA